MRYHSQGTTTSVRSLQEMLRILSHVYEEIPFLYPDGHFGEHTLESVMAFQRLFALPVTGTVDKATWDALTSAFSAAEKSLSISEPDYLFPHNGLELSPGQSSPLLYTIQGMFCALATVFPAVKATKVTGILDDATASNLSWLQEKTGCSNTGCLDCRTAGSLCHLYKTFVTSQQEAPNEE